jgi:hypothetical protein
MAKPKITVEDWVDISNFFGRYQWLVDTGDEEGWSNLFTEDGAFIGLMDGFYGREALKQIPSMARSIFNCRARHMPGSIWMEYGDSQDEVFLHCYNLFSFWPEGQETQWPQLANSRLHLLRIDGGWMIKSNTIEGLRDMG